MSGNDKIERFDNSDWSRAWQAVARLATARESLQDIPRAHSLLEPATGEYAGSEFTAAAISAATLEHNGLAGALAEIEEASAALRRSEPMLARGLPARPLHTAARRYWSVWVLIGAIWISASLVVATATGAILYILG